MSTTCTTVNLTPTPVREVAHFPCSAQFYQEGLLEQLTLTGTPFEIAQAWWGYSKQYPEATMTTIDCTTVERTIIRFERRLKRPVEMRSYIVLSGRAYAGIKVTFHSPSITTYARLN